MKKVLQFAALAIIIAGCGCGMSPQDRLTVNDKKINKIIAQMTLEEKIGQMNLPVAGDIVTGQAKSSNISERIRKRSG